VSGMTRRPRGLPPALLLLAALAGFAFLGPVAHPTDPDAVDLAHTLAPGSAAHPLGTDESGRDVLARLMAGGRVSLVVAAAAALVALGLGTAVGGTAGAAGPGVDAVLARLVDAVMAVPVFFVLLVALTLFGSSLPTLILAIGLTSWMGIARLVRAETLALKQAGHVEAARALGAHGAGLWLRHLLPHLATILAAGASLGVAQAVLVESALSFLGLGIQRPAASWGNMLTGAHTTLYAAPRLAVYPGLLIVATVLGFNGLAERLPRPWRPGSAWS